MKIHSLKAEVLRLILLILMIGAPVYRYGVDWSFERQSNTRIFLLLWTFSLALYLGWGELLSERRKKAEEAKNQPYQQKLLAQLEGGRRLNRPYFMAMSFVCGFYLLIILLLELTFYTPERA